MGISYSPKCRSIGDGVAKGEREGARDCGLPAQTVDMVEVGTESGWESVTVENGVGKSQREEAFNKGSRGMLRGRGCSREKVGRGNKSKVSDLQSNMKDLMTWLSKQVQGPLYARVPDGCSAHLEGGCVLHSWPPCIHFSL